MSMGFQWEFVISPVKEEEIQEVLDKLEYVIDDHLHEEREDDGPTPMLTCWGSGAISGAIQPDDRHEEIKTKFPDKHVITRWRCTEFDEWDEEHGS
jgi:hypothetical protein